MVSKSYEKAKQEAFSFYKNWKKTGSYCKAFNEKILVTNKGWYHLIGKTGYKKRTIPDKYRRLKLLPYAKQIIETASTIQNIRTQKGRVYYTLDAMLPVKEKEVTHLRKVRVIIIENNRGEKVFLSVMDKK